MINITEKITQEFPEIKILTTEPLAHYTNTK